MLGIALDNALLSNSIGNNFRAISEIIQQKVVFVSWEELL